MVLKGFPNGVTQGQQYNIGEKPTVTLYTYINQHLGAPKQKQTCYYTEGFNGWGGRGYDDFFPGEVTKTAPSGDRTT